MRKFTIFIVSFVFLGMAQGHDLNTYTIQIGTYNNPPDQILQAAKKFGPVHQIWFNKLTRITVGEFSHKSEALKQLLYIKQAGFDDAFVRKVGTARIHDQHDHLEIQKFNLLAKELNARSLYVNGKMYLRQGDHYIKIP